MQNRIMIQMLVAAAMIFGVQTAANAQFGGLLKKAKKALNIEVTTGDSDESSSSETSSSGGSSSSSSGSHPKKLKDLDPEIFIYQPVDDPSTALFYDHNNEKVKQWYRKYRETNLYGSSIENLGKWWITEFEDWQSPRGVRQIPVMEYPLAANYSYFVLHPDEVEGYRCFVRAEVALNGCACVFPYEKRMGQWYEVYPSSNQSMRRVKMNDGREIYMQETNEARHLRWGNIRVSDAMECVTYETIKKAMEATLSEMEQAEKEGRIIDAFFLLEELNEMRATIEEDQYVRRAKEVDPDGYQDVLDACKMYGPKFVDWRLQSLTQLSGTTEMPKAATVSAAIQTQATQKAKAKFGATFVKAIVVESDWHVYTDPHNFNRTDHRTMDVDVIIKENGEYYVSHQMLWQNYQAGSWGSYDMRQKSPGKQKVNYK